jgi:hypothetical protein
MLSTWLSSSAVPINGTHLKPINLRMFPNGDLCGFSMILDGNHGRSNKIGEDFTLSMTT